MDTRVDPVDPDPTDAAAFGGHSKRPPDGDALLVPIDPTTLHGRRVPERLWLVPDWIPMARVTGLYGAGGEGKTLLAQMLATASALHNTTWLSLPVRRCNSLLLFCEDDQDEMWRRQEDINRHYGCTFADLGAMRWLPRLGFDNTLMTFDAGRAHLTEMFDDLLRAAQDHSAGLVIVDTLADVFGGEENARAQARAFAQTALGGIARQTGAAVLALAHPSLTGINSGTGASGSTGWIATYRSHLHLATPKTDNGDPVDRDARALTRGKANFARRGETIEMRWQNGVLIADQPAAGVSGAIEKRTCDDVFLRLLNRLAAEGRHVSDNSKAGNYAPRLFAQQPDRERYTEKDFKLAMERLFAAQAIRKGTYRSPYRHTLDCILPAGMPA